MCKTNYRDGLSVMTFLLDLINDAAGYSESYYKTSKQRHTIDGLSKE